MKSRSFHYRRKIFFVLALMLMLTIPVHAEGGESSEHKKATVNGYTYTYYAYIYAGIIDNTPYANSGVSIRAFNQTVPAGWMYTQSKVYTNSGVLKATSIANTNSSERGYLDSNTASLKPADRNTLYYGIGTAGFWNGKDYSYYTTYKTPSFMP